MAYAVPILNDEDVFTLSAGVPVSGGSIAVLAPGTGLERRMTKDKRNLLCSCFRRRARLFFSH